MLPFSAAQHLHKLKYVINANSPTILTAVGVTGSVATAYLAGQASFKAARIIDRAELELENELKFPATDIEFTKKTKVKLVWREYLPAVGVGTLTLTSIIMANRISSKRVAALAIAGGISERALQEYKDKVLEKVGPKQEEKVRDEIAQDHVTKNPPAQSQVIITGAGDVLCYDDLTGRYFHSNVEKIKAAENRVNYRMLQDDYCSLSYFFEEIGLKPTTYSDMVGWNVNAQMEVRFSATMTEDSRPCMVMSYVHAPEIDYDKLWAMDR